MSDRLAYVLVEEDKTTCYYHRWGNVNFPLKLVEGPQIVRDWAVNGYDSLSTATLDSCAEAEVLIDFDRKYLLYWHSLIDCERVRIPYIDALISEHWPGFTVQFAYGGRSDIAAYIGLQTQDPFGPGYPDAAVDPAELCFANDLEAAMFLLETATECWSASFSSTLANQHRYDSNVRGILKDFSRHLIQKVEREGEAGQSEALPEVVETAPWRGFYRMQSPEFEKLIGFLQPTEIILLDVGSAPRSVHENVAGSVFIPLLELPERYRDLPRNETIICIGGCSAVADAAAHFLIEKDFWSVASLNCSETELYSAFANAGVAVERRPSAEGVYPRTASALGNTSMLNDDCTPNGSPST